MEEVPRAFVISRPSLEEGSLRLFLKEEGTFLERSNGATEGEEIVEVAGRLCYMSFGQPQKYKPTEKYIAHLIEQGHESVLEHVSWSIILTGITRACSHQIVRHRVGFSFSQLSQQYHDDRTTEFLPPIDFAAFPSIRDIWERLTEATRHTYTAIVDDLQSRREQIADILWSGDHFPDESTKKREVMRYIRSIARSVLPNSAETKMMVTANARAWRHFFTVRGASEGDVEMRRVSAAIFDAIVVDAPSLFADFQRETLPDGSPRVVRLSATLSEAVV